MSGNFPLNKRYTEDSSHEFANQTLLGGGRVGTRLSIFVCLSILFLALFAGGYIALEKNATAADLSLGETKALVELATSVEQQTFQLRNAENLYLLGKDPKFKEKFNKAAIEINESLNELYSRVDTGAVRDHITTINDGLTQYTEEFGRLINSNNEPVITDTDFLARQIVVTAKELQEALAQIPEASGLRDILARIMRHEKDFTLYGDPRLLSEITKHGQKFNRLILQNYEENEVQSQLNDLMELYQSQLINFAKARNINKRNTDRLNEIFIYMAPSVDSLAAFASNQLKTTEQGVSSIIKLSRVTLLGGGSLLLFILMISGVILLRSLALPIREASIVANQLISGNLKIKIPALGNGDEIGELSRALAVFGATLEEVVQLRIDTEVARAAAIGAEERLQEKMDAIEQATDTVEHVVATEKVSVEEEKTQLPQPREHELRPIASSNALTGPISTISQQVAQSSKNVTDAAYEAERAGALTQGLTNAVSRLAEIKELLSEVAEQADFLVFKRGSRFPRNGDAPGNLVVLSPENRSSSDQLGVGDEAVGKRFDIIRAANTQVTCAIKDISELIGDAKDTAHKIAANSSGQALKITSDLLKQSEYLRWMLNEQVGKLEMQPDSYDNNDDVSETGHKPPPGS